MVLRLSVLALLLPVLCSAQPKSGERVRQLIKQEARKKVKREPQANPATLTVNSSVVNPSKSLEYTVYLNGEALLTSGAMLFRSDGSTMDHLTLNRSYTETGIDRVGTYQATVYEWYDPSVNGAPPVITQIKSYPDVSDVVVFGQTFPKGLSGTSNGNGQDLPGSSFPSFLVDSQSTQSTLGWVHFGGFMAAGRDLQHGTLSTKGMGEWAGGMHGTGPLCLFRYDLSESVVISPLNEFMAASDGYDSGLNNIQFGVMGNATEYPAGWGVEFIMVAFNGGVNQAMYRWGDEMLKVYDRSRDDSWDRDLTLNYLGYTTDRGAFYFFNTEPYGNYQQTMLDVANYAQYMHIPYKYFLMDEWWYYTGNDPGLQDGLANWTARPDVFPDGMKYIYEQTNLLIQAHCKFFSLDNVYANNNPIEKQSGYNGPTFPFLWSDSLGIPTTVEFWDEFFYQNNDWGLTVFELDFLSTYQDYLPQLNEDVTLGQEWLTQMASMAFEHDLSIQYCMSYPRHVLTSLLTTSVTQCRGSADFAINNKDINNWQIGTSGLLTGSIGLGNSKDGFWSSQYPQYQPKYDTRNLVEEKWPRLESASASMNNGPVQIGDQLLYSDIELIMRSCNQNGRLLRPGRNAASLDRYFRACAFKDGSEPSSPVLWTEARIPGYPYPYAYVLAANMTDPFYLQTTDVDLDQNGVSYLLFEANTTSVLTRLDPSSQGYKLTSDNPWNFEFMTMIPLDESISSAWYLQGEIDKWISVSPFRFTQISLNSDSVSVELTGAVGEIVHVGFVKLSTMMNVVVDCPIGETLLAYAHCSGNQCSCSSSL